MPADIRKLDTRLTSVISVFPKTHQARTQAKM
jgi:hypothetical protein